MGRSKPTLNFFATTLIAAVLLAPGRNTLADIDHTEYEPRTTLGDRRAQADYLRQIESDRAGEARREAEAALTEAQADAARKRAEASRPWAERLTEQRCTACHAGLNYLDNAHTPPFWWAVAVRMKYVNGAAVTWDELGTIVPWLSETAPASGIGELLEWFAGLSLIVLPIPIYLLLRKLSRRR